MSFSCSFSAVIALGKETALIGIVFFAPAAGHNRCGFGRCFFGNYRKGYVFLCSQYLTDSIFNKCLIVTCYPFLGHFGLGTKNEFRIGEGEGLDGVEPIKSRGGELFLHAI